MSPPSKPRMTAPTGRSTWTREDYVAEIDAHRAHFNPRAPMHKSAIKLARLERELALRFPAAAS